MKASETAVGVLLGGPKQFMIPLFQRPYSWDEGRWATLWSDIVETRDVASESQHFLGSVVTKSLPGTPEGVSPYLVIDGQQRLLTLTLLLAALRDACRLSSPDLAERIDSFYLRNYHVPELNAYKVVPTQADRVPYFGFINGRQAGAQKSNIEEAYGYFRDRLNGSDEDGQPLDAKKMEQRIVGGLSVVSVTLGSEDNEYRIFESLNAKGMPLKQVDLLRNYLFMRIPANQQDETYVSLWRPLEIGLGDNLEDFFRYEFMSTGEFVRESDVYQQWKARLDRLQRTDLIEKLRDLGEHARYFERMVNPKKEPDLAIRDGFLRLNRWGAQTIYPFLLFAYGEYIAGALDAYGFANLLSVLESFLVRRLFAGVPTNALNRLFLRLGSQLPEGTNLLEGTIAVLSMRSRRWPTDQEFREAILRYPLYTDSRPDQRRLILESLEKSHKHKEAPGLTDLTIEHLMPQTLTNEWRQALGPDAPRVHEKLLHILGNLTLTGYNPELSNSQWIEKRKLLNESNLELNKEAAREEVWTEAQIVNRSNQLAELCIKLWSGPVAMAVVAPGEDEEVVLPAQWANFYQGCIDRLEPFLGVKLVRKTTTILSSEDGTCVVVCLVSREYDGRGYWWTFRSRHEKALALAARSYLALGCGSVDQVLAIPFTDWKPHLEALSQVVRNDQMNWHVHIRRDGGQFKLHRKGGLPDVDVTRYLVPSRVD